MICSHQWIDPDAPPIARTPYAPIVGPAPHQMKAGHFYRCANCGELLYIMTRDESSDARRI